MYRDLKISQTAKIYAPINVKTVGGGGGGGKQGMGQRFDIFQKIDVKFPTLGQKCEVKYN